MAPKVLTYESSRQAGGESNTCSSWSELEGAKLGRKSPTGMAKGMVHEREDRGRNKIGPKKYKEREIERHTLLLICTFLQTLIRNCT